MAIIDAKNLLIKSINFSPTPSLLSRIYINIEEDCEMIATTVKPAYYELYEQKFR